MNLFSSPFSECRRLGYSCEQMFSVVSEVSSYHSFVPWCKKSDVIHSDTKKLRAELVIGFPPLVGEEMSFSH